MADALRLATFHDTVTYFARRFEQDALEEQPRLRSAGLRPEFMERNRFERAFYRFELYRIIITRNPPTMRQELRDLFFSFFSTWEIEQLACVRDYLIRLVAERKTSPCRRASIIS